MFTIFKYTYLHIQVHIWDKKVDVVDICSFRDLELIGVSQITIIRLLNM